MYLVEAQTYIDSYIDISLADSFFEETEKDTETIEHNDSVLKKATEAIKKAVQALIKMVKDTLEKIQVFVKDRWLTADERRRFKEFKEMVKSDPELAKQKVTIMDFREYEKLYDEAIKKLEEEAKKEEPSDEVGEEIVSNLAKKIADLTNKGKDVATRAAMAVTLRTALDIADRNALCAKAIKLALDEELISLQNVEKELGKRESNKFKRKIDWYAKDGWLHRFKVKTLQKKELTLAACLRDQKNKLLAFAKTDENGNITGVNAKTVARGMYKNSDITTKALGGKVATAKLAGKLASSSMRATKKAATTVIDGVQLAKFLELDKLKESIDNKK